MRINHEDNNMLSLHLLMIYIQQFNMCDILAMAF